MRLWVLCRIRLCDRGLRSRNLYALLVIAIVVMASMVVVLRGKSQQTTVLDVSNLNSLESSYYIKLNNTIWRDPPNKASQKHRWSFPFHKTTRATSKQGPRPHA